MAQNISSAVMAQRREPKDSLDDFPTPPWGTRVLLERLNADGWIDPLMKVREPAANRGHMVKVLREYFAPLGVIASDVADYGAGFPVEDYLFPGDPTGPVDWTITNPPFRLAEQFIEKALRTSEVGVAVLVRTSFLEGEGRWNRCFNRTPPFLVLQFTERLVMHEGRLPNPNVAEPMLDKKTGQIVMRKPSTATSYCWLVWTKSNLLTGKGTHLDWTGICRERLERPGDYEEIDHG